MPKIVTHANVFREKRELPPYSPVNNAFIEYKFTTHYRPGSADILDSQFDKFVTVTVRQLDISESGGKVPVEVTIIKPGTTEEVLLDKWEIMEARAPALGRTATVGPLTGDAATASSDASAVQFAINTGRLGLGLSEVGLSPGGVLGDWGTPGPERPPVPPPEVDNQWRYEIKEDDPQGEWTVRIRNKSKSPYDTRVFSVDIRHPDMVLNLSESKIPFSLLNRLLGKIKTLADIKVRLDRNAATMDFRPEFKDLTGLEKMSYEIEDVGDRFNDINLEKLEVELKPQGDDAIAMEAEISFETEGGKEIRLRCWPDADITKLGFNIGLVFSGSGGTYWEKRDLAGDILGAHAPPGRFTLQIEPDFDVDSKFDGTIRSELNDKLREFTGSSKTKKALDVIAEHVTDALMFLATGTEDRLFYDLRPTSTDIVVRHYARSTERLRRLLERIEDYVPITAVSTGTVLPSGPPAGTSGRGFSGLAGETRSLSELRVAPGLTARPRPADHTGPGGGTRKIDHIVVLMLENRSFDHMLGYLKNKGRADILGLGAPANHTNPIPGTSREQSIFRLSKGVDVEIDPSHGVEAQKEQIAGGAMSGFVANYMKKEAVRSDVEGRMVMGFYDDETLSVFDKLADEYLVCNRWFCSHPGPTYPNRFISLMGSTPDIHNLDLATGGAGAVKGTTIFDLLTAAGVSWNYVESNIAFLRMFDSYRVDEERIIQRSEWLSMARDGRLPAVSWIDPHFFELEIEGNADDDHAPGMVLRGQEGVQEIYEALTANEAQWAKTMFIITYDEHGGFYDHVPPHGLNGETDPVVHKIHEEGATHYGPRVPAFIVSPWVRRRSTSDTVFDHTSILKTILVNFIGEEAATQELLGKRVDAANNLLDLLEESKRSDIPSIAKPAPVPAPVEPKIYIPQGPEARTALNLAVGLFGLGPKLRRIIADRAMEGPEVPLSRRPQERVIVTIQQKNTMRYLDAYETSGKDYRLVTRPKQENDSQKWEITPLGNHTFTLRQVSSGRFVDAYQSKKHDYRVVTRPSQENDTQRWIIKGVGGGLFTIQQKSSGRYMDAHETSRRDYEVVTRTYQGNDSQRWIIVDIENKRFTFQPATRFE